MRLVPIIGVGLALTFGACAQESDVLAEGYREATECAGKFRWVLDASSGGQPALNEYSLEERVRGVDVWLGRADFYSRRFEPSPDYEAEVQEIADDTIGRFFDDPDAVEAELLTCAMRIGMREG